MAVFGTVIAQEANGAAQIEVLESFKGPTRGTMIRLQPEPGSCTAPMPALASKVLVIGFGQGLNACSQYAPDHFLLEAVRAIANQAP